MEGPWSSRIIEYQTTVPGDELPISSGQSSVRCRSPALPQYSIAGYPSLSFESTTLSLHQYRRTKITQLVQDLRVLLHKCPFPALGQVDVEDVEVAVTGHHHHLRSIATHGDDTPERTSVSIPTLALI